MFNFSSVSIVNFEQVNVRWDEKSFLLDLLEHVVNVENLKNIGIKEN